MTGTKRQFALAAVLNGGRFSWKYGSSGAEGDMNLQMYKDLAMTAERGKFDAVFLADGYSTKTDGLSPSAAASLSTIVQFEPTTLIAAMAAVTNNIGLIVTGSTSYLEPYDWARRIASLDFISGGRIGWNLITSQFTSEAQNYGREAPFSNETRYARAREFLEICLGLWDSWDDDAFVRDKASGIYTHLDKMHELNHRGQFFSVRGPLNVARMPQGQPVLCQAGESEAGIDLAAAYADMVFCKANDLAHGQEFYARVKGKLVGEGRKPETLNIMVGLICMPGRTREEAYEKVDKIHRTISDVEARDFAVQFMGREYDIPGQDINAPLPELPHLDAIARAKRIKIVSDGRRLSLVEVGRALGAGTGHLTLIGTASEIADEMEQIVDNGAADGFAWMPYYMPGNLNDFVDLVIPELQRRGRVRTEYASTTLRGNLGLERPKIGSALARRHLESVA